MKSSIPIFARYHGLSIGFCALLGLGLLEEFTDWMPEDDTAIFFAICGFMAGSIYSMIHYSFKDQERQALEKQIAIQNKITE